MSIEVGKLYKVIRNDMASTSYSAPARKAGKRGVVSGSAEIVWIPKGTWLLVTEVMPSENKGGIWCWCIYNNTVIVINDLFLDKISGRP